MYETKKWAGLFAGPSLAFVLSAICWVEPANADVFSFNTGAVTNSMASASRPESTGKFEIESADDFATTGQQTFITSATFTGLLTGGATTANIGSVRVEIYRVFPNDSNVARTSGPPTFSTVNVPTRVNSPSDVAFAERSTTSGSLTFTTTLLSPTFTALNSVQPGGIHPMPNQTTLGNGSITGQEVEFHISLPTAFLLPADHYFFVPQVEVAGGEFLWLSGTRPLPPGTFPPGVTDLQSWTRDSTDISVGHVGIDPDWLRIGTDIVGTGTFNAAFSLDGFAVPLPGALPLFATGLAGLGLLGWRRKRKAAA